MQEQQFYFEKDGQVFGPCSYQEIEEGYQQGQLKPNDCILNSSTSLWDPMEQILGPPPAVKSMASQDPASSTTVEPLVSGGKSAPKRSQKKKKSALTQAGTIIVFVLGLGVLVYWKINSRERLRGNIRNSVQPSINNQPQGSSSTSKRLQTVHNQINRLESEYVRSIKSAFDRNDMEGAIQAVKIFQRGVAGLNLENVPQAYRTTVPELISALDAMAFAAHLDNTDAFREANGKRLEATINLNEIAERNGLQMKPN
jgi:hypothetical protein